MRRKQKWCLPIVHEVFGQKKSYVTFHMYDKLLLLISKGSFLVSHNTHSLIIPTHTLPFTLWNLVESRNDDTDVAERLEIGNTDIEPDKIIQETILI